MTVELPVEILVEEQSAEFALRTLLPRIVPGVPFEIRRFQGKPDLLKKLPARLAGYASWPGVAGSRVVVLVDRDDDDCVALRAQLQRHGYHRAGLSKITAAVEVAAHMQVDDNNSRSFQVFRDGVRQLTRKGDS